MADNRIWLSDFKSVTVKEYNDEVFVHFNVRGSDIKKSVSLNHNEFRTLCKKMSDIISMVKSIDKNLGNTSAEDTPHYKRRAHPPRSKKWVEEKGQEDEYEKYYWDI